MEEEPVTFNPLYALEEKVVPVNRALHLCVCIARFHICDI